MSGFPKESYWNRLSLGNPKLAMQRPLLMLTKGTLYPAFSAPSCHVQTCFWMLCRDLMTCPSFCFGDFLDVFLRAFFRAIGPAFSCICRLATVLLYRAVSRGYPCALSSQGVHCTRALRQSPRNSANIENSGASAVPPVSMRAATSQVTSNQFFLNLGLDTWMT